jgi:hypothetical protein
VLLLVSRAKPIRVSASRQVGAKLCAAGQPEGHTVVTHAHGMLERLAKSRCFQIPLPYMFNPTAQSCHTSMFATALLLLLL